MIYHWWLKIISILPHVIEYLPHTIWTWISPMARMRNKDLRQHRGLGQGKYQIVLEGWPFLICKLFTIVDWKHVDIPLLSWKSHIMMKNRMRKTRMKWGATGNRVITKISIHQQLSMQKLKWDEWWRGKLFVWLLEETTGIDEWGAQKSENDDFQNQ